MATFIDIHDVPGVKAQDAADAHAADLRVQGQYGVDYQRYWVDEEAGNAVLPRRGPRRGDRGARPPRGPRPRSPGDPPGARGRLIGNPTRAAASGAARALPGSHGEWLRHRVSGRSVNGAPVAPLCPRAGCAP